MLKRQFWKYGYFYRQVDRTGNWSNSLKKLCVSDDAGNCYFNMKKLDEISSQYLESREFIAPVRVGMVRLYAHFYNTKEEIDRVIYELDKFQRDKK